LELDHALFETLGFRQVLGEFRGQFAVDEEFEIVAIGDDVDGVPIALSDVILGQAILDRGDGWLVVLADDQPITSEAAVFPAARRVEIPCTHHILANANMADIGVVTLEMALARLVGDGANAHAAIALAGKTVGKLKLQIGDLLVWTVCEIASAFVTIADNHSVLHGPGCRCLGGHSLPTLESLSIEDRDEIMISRLRIFSL